MSGLAIFPPSRRWAGAAATLVLGLAAGPLAAQGAIDPNVAPRAAALERQGERQLATEMLGRYLAVAQSDGRAWFLLSRFYRQDASDWHREGHGASPGADLYLSLASVAADEAYRLSVDSAGLFRALLAMDRAVLTFEDSGWTAARDGGAHSMDDLPPAVRELGLNLVAACPRGGVILAGNDFEQLAVWFGVVSDGGRSDLVALRSSQYLTDSIYQRRMARLIGVDPALGLREALGVVARTRAICLPPAVDVTVLAEVPVRPMRMLRVAGPGDEPPGVALGLTDIALEARAGSSLWTSEVLAEYSAAARHNQLLCRGLASIGGALPGSSCRP